MQPTPGFVRTLMRKAIRQHVATAARSRQIVTAADFAAEIARTYPACHLDQAELIDEIAHAAASAGVAVEVGPPKRAV